MGLSAPIELHDVSGKRERSKAANRHAILEAARRVFAQLGYEGTTVRDIIRSTDLASGTFYNYFKSKEEVFQALQDDSALRFRPLLQAQCEQADSFAAFVRHALSAYFQFLADETASGRMIPGPDAGRLIVRADTPEMRAVFEEVRVQIERAVGSGLAPAVDADYLAAAAIGMARDVGQRMIAREDEVANASAFCADLILNGIGGASGRMI